ncbi:conserved hypothetical protein [Methylocella silvestris BL2]|uniref:YD repeat protein n=1 Tax=Methylocella silvestris (strain DSM 15510 / CIP 108128 / LMG 27833 / NCIMB 13906 / BL2) TaxID=395965 RepID=B8ELT0_METSB|nr:DUF6156 family protein [Methylocella silvestris]ACK50711.1 conserved hypothetical protein [Methylocella silvestris BL2]
MTPQTKQDCRYFLSYSGVKLPINLVSPLDPEALANRNTYIRAWFDARERLIRFEKLVYGEIELVHCYDYDDDGVLRRAAITMLDEEPVYVSFDQASSDAPAA